jgi:uncharacterized protein YecE (DUF72 family)
MPRTCNFGRSQGIPIHHARRSRFRFQALATSLNVCVLRACGYGDDILSRSGENRSGFMVRVGCAGWNIPRSSAQLFPSGDSHLERYSQCLNCCEINSSFHRPHKPSTWERWAESVPTGFLFSVKAPKAITHDASLSCAPDVLSAFLKQIRYLGNKLGPILIQLPPSRSFDPVVAKEFLSLLREQHAGDVVLEPRHSTWFEQNADELLKQFRIARVAADPTYAPGGATPAGYAELVYYRLHGSPRRYYSSYSAEFLETLAARLMQLETGTQAWCIFDNTASGAAAPDALQLRRQLHRGAQ